MYIGTYIGLLMSSVIPHIYYKHKEKYKEKQERQTRNGKKGEVARRRDKIRKSALITQKKHRTYTEKNRK